MAKKESLPIEVHDHFRKANKLHGYVEKALGEATKHALEIGQELLAAKATIPHGSWESECDRLFDGSASTARFYMQFAKNMAALPKRQQSCVLFLEGTLKGAADAAKKAAGKKPPSRSHQEEPEDEEEAEEVIDVEFEEADDTGEDDDSEGIPEEPISQPPRKGKDKPVDLGKCPNCAGAKWDEDDDGWYCAKCRHPYGEPAGDVDDDRLKTQRQKTVKTAEALMRAFDDLQCMKARPEHDKAIETCKGLLETARGWK